jgi:hypothetical protein
MIRDGRWRMDDVGIISWQAGKLTCWQGRQSEGK